MPVIESSQTLRQGARISLHGSVTDVTGRVQLSSGTKCVDYTQALAERYAKGAFIPKGPWRTATKVELDRLGLGAAWSADTWSVGTDVAVIRIPSRYVSPFELMLEALGIRERCTPGEYTSVSRHPEWTSSLEALQQYAETLACGGSTGAVYFRITDPGQVTVTKDEFGASAQALAGLHLDSWDRLPLRHRHRSRSRLCVNLGREARYSLFINLPLMDMFKQLGLRDPEDIYSDWRGLVLGQRFMRAWSDYPVVRLRIEPGEAYLLPTDNLIHDASTEGNRFPDITLTFLGYFMFGGPSV